MPSIVLTPGPYRPQRPWFKKKRYLMPLALFAMLGLIGSVSPEQEPPPATAQTARAFAAAPAEIGEDEKAADAAAVQKAADAKKAADAAAAQKAAEAAAAKKAADAVAVKKAADAAAAQKAAEVEAARKAAEAEAAKRAVEAAAAQKAAEAAAAAQEAAAAQAAAAQNFDNCTRMRTVYPHGVGMPGAVDQTSGSPVTTFEQSAELYQANSGSDRDGDSIACEQK